MHVPTGWGQVWLKVSLDEAGRVAIAGGSDSELSAGVVALLREAMGGLTPQQLLEVGGRAIGQLDG
jgi:sulfur transfer protein SufE